MIRAWLVGGEELRAKFDRAEPKIRKALRLEIERIAMTFLAHVKGNKLSGQVLRVVTGRLRRSINRRIVETSNATTAIVGTNVWYGAYHEYGYRGVENVRAHLRTIKQAFGKNIPEHLVEVRGHARRVKYPEKSFLRSSLRDLAPQIRERLERAARAAAAVAKL